MSVGISSKANGAGTYRVVVKMFWYRKNGSKLGSATHVVEYYSLRIGGTPFASGQDCLAYIGLN